MIEDSDMPDTEALITLFTTAMHNKLQAMELENEALKMRLNEARMKLELAKAKLEEAGLDSAGLGFESKL